MANPGLLLAMLMTELGRQIAIDSCMLERDRIGGNITWLLVVTSMRLCVARTPSPVFVKRASALLFSMIIQDLALFKYHIFLPKITLTFFPTGLPF